MKCDFTLEDDIKKFEEKIQIALEIKGKYIMGFPEDLIKYFIPPYIDIKEFYRIYSSQKIYPQDRIKSLSYDLMDIKIQIIFLFEFHFGLYNHTVHKLTPEGQSFTSNPYLLLRHLSLDQTSIVTSPILWERIMNFVYFLETGNEIEKEIGKNKKSSKKNIFFNSLEKNDSPWKFLIPYKSMLIKHDNDFRTGEVHKKSTLRRHFMNDTTPDSASIMKLSNTAINMFWKNLQYILSGDPSRVFYEEVSS